MPSRSPPRALPRHHVSPPQELKRLDDDANVFKAVGPVLVKQDLVEARSNVSNRLDFIKKDIDRIDGQLKTVEGKMLEREKEVGPV